MMDLKKETLYRQKAEQDAKLRIKEIHDEYFYLDKTNELTRVGVSVGVDVGFKVGLMTKQYVDLTMHI